MFNMYSDKAIQHIIEKYSTCIQKRSTCILKMFNLYLKSTHVFEKRKEKKKGEGTKILENIEKNQ